MMTFDEAVFRDYLTYEDVPNEISEQKKDRIKLVYGEIPGKKVEV